MVEKSYRNPLTAILSLWWVIAIVVFIIYNMSTETAEETFMRECREYTKKTSMQYKTVAHIDRDCKRILRQNQFNQTEADFKANIRAAKRYCYSMGYEEGTSAFINCVYD